MKKIILSFATALIALGVNAQQNLYTSVESLKETTYTKYDISKDGDKYTLFSKREDFIASVVKNSYGKPGGIELKNVETGKTDISYDAREIDVDHYTHPSYQSKGGVFKSVFVMVDSVIYELQYFKKESMSFKFSYMYIPKIESASTGDEKKKMSMKEKLAAAKAKVSGGPFVERQRKKDHEKVIKDYLKAMKSLQAKNPYSAQAKKEIAGLEEAEAKRIAEINAKNAAWEATEGKRIRELNSRDSGNDKGKITVINKGGKVCVTDGRSESKWLHTGSSASFDCSYGVYYGEIESTSCKMNKKGTIVPPNQSCGQKIEFNQR